MLLFVVFGILDKIVGGATVTQMWLIRYLFVCPVLLTVFVLTFFPVFHRVAQPALGATLLSSGFQAMSTNRAQTPLDKPTSLVIDNGGSGQLVASVDPVKNTSLYEGRVKGSTGDWLPSVFTGDSQHIEFNGLTPGQNYTIQVRALGGSTGQSDWSDPSTHMAM